MQKKKRLKKTIQTLLVVTGMLLAIPISITKHYIININPRGIREKKEEKINNKAIVEVSMDANFIDDLNADSLDIVELVMAMEGEFDISIPDEDAEKIKMVGDAVEYVKLHA